MLQEAVGDMIIESGIVKASETAGIVLASAFTGNNKDENRPFSKGGEQSKDYPIQEYLEIGLGVLRMSPNILGFNTKRIYLCGEWIFIN